MNLDAVMRSFTDDELETLRQAQDAIVAGRPLTPEQQAADRKWHELGGDSAMARKHAGIDKQPPTTQAEVIEHFNEAELKLLEGALTAIRDRRTMQPAEEIQYARYLAIGGELVRLPGREEEDRRILARHLGRMLGGRTKRPSTA